MRDVNTIDSELRLLAAIRWSLRECGGVPPSTDRVDALLDERAHGRGARGAAQKVVPPQPWPCVPIRPQ